MTKSKTTSLDTRHTRPAISLADAEGWVILPGSLMSHPLPFYTPKLNSEKFMKKWLYLILKTRNERNFPEKKRFWSTAEDLNPHTVGIWNFIFFVIWNSDSELIRISLENINDNFLKSLFWLRIKIITICDLKCSNMSSLRDDFLNFLRTSF